MSSTLRKWAFGVLYSGFNCWILNAIFYAFSFVISRISGFSPPARKSQFDCSFIIVQPLGLISVACQKEKGSIKKKRKNSNDIQRLWIISWSSTIIIPFFLIFIYLSTLEYPNFCPVQILVREEIWISFYFLKHRNPSLRNLENCWTIWIVLSQSQKCWGIK
jgi:heme/copper-type cytochrome/quinol oxidase subunit 3